MSSSNLNPPTISRLQNISAWFDAINETIARGARWLVLLMAIVTFAIVVLRYAFDLGWVWMQESVIYLHAAFFMLAMGYAMHHDAHVRVDIYYQNFSRERKARVDFWGTLFLLFPFCLMVLYFSAGYVFDSYVRLESSPEAGGLPLVFLLKTLIVILPVLLMLQGTARALRSYLTMQGLESAAETQEAAES